MRMGRATISALLVMLVLTGYLVADSLDLLPGPLTTAPPASAGPLPTAPGATVPPAVAGRADAVVRPPAGARLAARLGPILADPAMGPRPSVVVLDARSGQELHAVRGAERATPASTAKILTAAAALDRLGPTTQLPTRALLTGPAQVTLRGGGDIFLGAGVSDPAAIQGHAGLTSLARTTATALRAKGVRRVTLKLDDMMFPGLGSGARLAPGWDPSDVGAGFVAPVTALAMNAGRLKNEHYAPRQADPGMAAARTYAAALRRVGITVAPAITRARAATSSPQLATVWSAPISDVVELVLRTSDNNGADVLARLVALKQRRAPTGPGGGAAVLDEVADLGVPTGGMRLADGSGLAKGSLLSAQALARTLYIAGRRPSTATLATSLPIAGVTGTMTDRFRAPDEARSRGLVRAKTGTLTGTSTLAGTVRDASGGTLIFAIMTGVSPDAVGARKVLDRAVNVLAGCGCR